MTAALTPGSGRSVVDMDSVHRFTDLAYADLTLRLRAGHDPAHLFDQLHALGRIRLHRSIDDAHEDIAAATTAGIGATTAVAATVAANDK